MIGDGLVEVVETDRYPRSRTAPIVHMLRIIGIEWLTTTALELAMRSLKTRCDLARKSASPTLVTSSTR